jgi:hypothetical protein
MIESTRVNAPTSQSDIDHSRRESCHPDVLIQKIPIRIFSRYSSRYSAGYFSNLEKVWFKLPVFAADLTYRGELQDNGKVSGTVVVQGQDIGSFTG